MRRGDVILDWLACVFDSVLAGSLSRGSGMLWTFPPSHPHFTHPWLQRMGWRMLEVFCSWDFRFNSILLFQPKHFSIQISSTSHIPPSGNLVARVASYCFIGLMRPSTCDIKKRASTWWCFLMVYAGWISTGDTGWWTKSCTPSGICCPKDPSTRIQHVIILVCTNLVGSGLPRIELSCETSGFYKIVAIEFGKLGASRSLCVEDAKLMLFIAHEKRPNFLRMQGNFEMQLGTWKRLVNSSHCSLHRSMLRISRIFWVMVCVCLFQ